MHDVQSKNMLTRRTSLLVAAAAPQLLGQKGGRSPWDGQLFILRSGAATAPRVDVEDVQAALDKAAELGGKKLVGPINIPAGTFAWFEDPDGNTIGLLKQAKP